MPGGDAAGPAEPAAAVTHSTAAAPADRRRPQRVRSPRPGAASSGAARPRGEPAPADARPHATPDAWSAGDVFDPTLGRVNSTQNSTERAGAAHRRPARPAAGASPMLAADARGEHRDRRRRSPTPPQALTDDPARWRRSRRSTGRGSTPSTATETEQQDRRDPFGRGAGGRPCCGPACCGGCGRGGREMARRVAVSRGRPCCELLLRPCGPGSRAAVLREASSWRHFMCELRTC